MDRDPVAILEGNSVERLETAGFTGPVYLHQKQAPPKAISNMAPLCFRCDRGYYAAIDLTQLLESAEPDKEQGLIDEIEAGIKSFAVPEDEAWEKSRDPFARELCRTHNGARYDVLVAKLGDEGYDLVKGGKVVKRDPVVARP